MKNFISLINVSSIKGTLLFGVIASLIMLFHINSFADDNLPQIATSYFGYHSGIIKSDGSLLMWGYNKNGQLGLGNIKESEGEFEVNPKLILRDAKFISLGNDTSAIIKSDDSLWMAGSNYYGQLGDGTTTDKSEFIKVMSNVASVSLGAYHVFAVKKDGSLWAWGSNEYGRFCNGTTDDSLTPVKIMDGVQTAYAGLAHSAIRKKDGTFWMCGYNSDGNLGLGYTSDMEVAPIEVYFQDNSGNKVSVKDVSLGYVSTLFLLEDSTLWFAGYDLKNDSCLGDSYLNVSVLTPEKIASNVKLARKAMTFSAYITNNNELYMCGDNHSGQLGLGEQDNNKSTPRRVMSSVKDVQIGHLFSAALTLNGTLYTWGSNSYGELGLGYDSEIVNRPTKVNIPIAFIEVPKGLTLDYTGQMQTGVARGNGYTVTGNTGRNVGTYKAKIRLAQGYVWSDGTTDDKEVEWRIIYFSDSSFVLQIPVGLTLEYNGEMQTGVPRGTGYTVTGNTEKNVGNYKAILRLAQGYVWSDGTTENKEVEWEIVKSPSSSHTLKIPEGNTLEYNGKTQTGVERGVGYTITGNTGTRVGSYKATLKLVQGYVWSDGTTGSKEVKWKIVRAYVIPIPDGLTLEFNGKTQIGVVRGTGYSISGNAARNVGSYIATLKLSNDGYGWFDGTTGNKEIKWQIVKAANPLTVIGKEISVKFKSLRKRGIVIASNNIFEIRQNKGSLSFKKGRGNKKITVNKKTGAINLKKGLGKGKYAVTVKVTAGGDEGYKAVTQTIKVKITVR